LKAFDIQEVSLRSAVSKDSFRDAVKHGDGKGSRVARLVDLLESDVVTDDFDSRLPSKGLLAGTAVIADVRNNVKAEFTSV